jgi:hypothetical protein
VATQAGAQPITLKAALSGANEFPSNASTGTGFTTVTYDPTAHSLRVQASFANLLGTTTASHIHCCVANPFDVTQTAGVATQTPTFAGFPLGVLAGTYDNTFDLTQASSWNAAYITANGGTAASAEAAFSAGLLSGRSYLNIHTSVVPGGEIRGFLAVVPEPSTYALMATGLAGVGMAAWRRRRA